MSMKPLLEVKDLSYHYPDGHKAIENMSFSVMPGEKVGIIGANGAGKSTLLLLLCGLIHASNGSICVNGTLSSKKTFKEIAKNLGVVFQNADDQLFSTSVLEDVLFGLIQAGEKREEAIHKAEKALEKTGTLHLKERAPSKLSGGEKRAVAIATAIVTDPELLILDEPTSGLDPRARRQLIALLRSLSHTQIITSHDLSFIEATCDRVLFISNGHLIADQPSKLILEDEDQLLAGGL